MTTSMYCLYVRFDYTYIDINTLAQGIKSFLASRLGSSCCWGSNLWHRFARNYQPAMLTIRYVCVWEGGWVGGWVGGSDIGWMDGWMD